MSSLLHTQEFSLQANVHTVWRVQYTKVSQGPHVHNSIGTIAHCIHCSAHIHSVYSRECTLGASDHHRLVVHWCLHVATVDIALPVCNCVTVQCRCTMTRVHSAHWYLHSSVTAACPVPRGVQGWL